MELYFKYVQVLGNANAVVDLIKGVLNAEYGLFLVRLVYLILLSILAVIAILIYKGATNQLEIKGFRIGKDREIDKLKEEVEKLKSLSQTSNAIAMKKGNFLQIFNTIIEGSCSLLKECDDMQFNRTKDNMFNLVLTGLANLIKRSENNIHKVSILIPNNNGNLKIYENKAVGHSIQGIEKLELPIRTSAAGYVYSTGEVYMCNDLTNDPLKLFKKHPKSKGEYYSLICVPIVVEDEVIAVLSLTGKEKNSFTKDDKDYLVYFASAISQLFYIIHIRKSICKGILQGRVRERGAECGNCERCQEEQSVS